MPFKKYRSKNTSDARKSRFGRRSLVSYLTACVAAILSCFCCTIPITLSALGFSDLAELPIFKQYGWVFDVLALLAMLAGMFFLWYHHSHQYTKLWDDLEFWLACLFMVILFGVLAIGIKTYLSKRVPNHSNGTQHSTRSI